MMFWVLQLHKSLSQRACMKDVRWPGCAGVALDTVLASFHRLTNLEATCFTKLFYCFFFSERDLL